MRGLPEVIHTYGFQRWRGITTSSPPANLLFDVSIDHVIIQIFLCVKKQNEEMDSICERNPSFDIYGGVTKYFH